MKKTGKRIPIQVAKNIANELGYTQVIIHAYDSDSGVQSVCTYGKKLADADNAAKGGNVIKKLLGFPEEACHSVPARVRRKLEKESKKINKMKSGPSLTIESNVDEVVKQLQALREKVTKLGFDYLQDKLPIEIEKFSKEMEPFICVEKSFTRAIKKLEKRK